jgi:hypothetical protein
MRWRNENDTGTEVHLAIPKPIVRTDTGDLSEMGRHAWPLVEIVQLGRGDLCLIVQEL